MSEVTSFIPGRYIIVKYPLHGTRNILKQHCGVIEKAAFSKNGLYCTVKCDDGTYRNLSYRRMIDPVVSK